VKVLLVVALLALAIYLVIRVIERRGVRRPPDGGGRTEPRVTGPDDDPDFLRDLERRRKRRENLDDS
jgi:hypothetical protein